MLQYTTYGRVSEPLSALVLYSQFVLRFVCDVGILRIEHYFVILDCFFVILEVL